MTKRLQHRRLEQAITHKIRLAELLPEPCPELGQFRVADYIGNPALKQDHSTDNRYARGFFADQGAWRDTVQLDQQAGISLAVFATFLVVEINAGTEVAEFVVLTPQRAATEDVGMYTGLMKAHNTDELCGRLAADSGLVNPLADEVNALLSWLRKPPAEQEGGSKKTASENWFGKLFSK